MNVGIKLDNGYFYTTECYTMTIKIIIPFYRKDITKLEMRSFTQVYNLLSNFYPIVIVKPKSLDLSFLLQNFPNLDLKSFEDDFFKNITGYNRLMMSTCFYERFLDCDYILIHQLDAYVFKNELQEWCEKGYDYIGAPWLQKPVYRLPIIKQSLSLLRKFRSISGKKDKSMFYDKVGNGGFSLRKVKSHYDITITHKDRIDYFLAQKKSHFYYEDVFWATEVNKQGDLFRYPSMEEALSFAFDKYPALCYKLNGNKLPFGCHAWYKRKMRSFWKPIIGF